MSDQQILEKAISLAIDGGWVPYEDGAAVAKGSLRDNTWQALIYHHEFARCLWGEDRYEVGTDHNQIKVHGWKWHLKNMVIAEDPIDYLGANI
jgi:hypothetical protein